MQASGYCVEEIPKDVAEEIIPLANKFSSDEPLAALIDLSEQENEEANNQVFVKCVKEGLCVYALSKDTGAIVGLLFGHIIKRGHHLLWGAIESENEKVIYLAKVLRILESNVDVLDQYNCGIALNHALICVDQAHRGKGLGSMMLKKLEEICLKNGIEAFAVCCTNIATCKIFLKMGYKMVFEYDYNQLEMNGKKLLDISISNGTTSAAVLTKRV